MGLDHSNIEADIAPNTETLINKSVLRWGEVIILTMALPVIGAVLRPQDIFFLHTLFPWGILPTLYIASRYGFFYGAVSLLCLALGVVGVSFFNNHYLVGLFDIFAGACLSVLLIGHVSYLRLKKLIKVERVNQLFQTKLNVLRRDYQLVKHSHDQLDAYIVTGEPSIRASLDCLRNAIFAIPTVDADQGVKQFRAEILQAFDSLGWINSAALYALDTNKPRGLVSIGVIGGHYDLTLDDPLLLKAMESGRLAVRTQHVLSEKHFPAMVVVPLTDSQEHIWAVLIIYDMVFSAMREEKLKYLACLAGFCADSVEQRLLCQDQSTTDWFAAEVRRAVINKKHYGLTSIVATFSQRPRKPDENIAPILQDIVRGQDAVIVKSSGGGIFKTMMLMPLTNTQQFQAFRHRLERILNEKTGSNLSQLNVFVEFHEVLRNEQGKDQTPNNLMTNMDSAQL